jgi:hypothetical protein
MFVSCAATTYTVMKYGVHVLQGCLYLLYSFARIIASFKMASQKGNYY